MTTDWRRQATSARYTVSLIVKNLTSSLLSDWNGEWFRLELSVLLDSSIKTHRLSGGRGVRVSSR